MNDRINKICSIVLNSIDTGVLIVDNEFRIVTFNKAAEKITGFSFEEVKGKHCFEVLRTDVCEKGCPLRESIISKSQVEGRRVEILNKFGKAIPVIVNAEPIIENGEIIGGIETFKDITSIETLKKEVKKDYRLGDIIGKSRAILEIFDILPDIAESNSTVLIEGPSGTGKEILARTIHNLSRRKNKPFVAFNCAALPDTLLESELFGYEKGAFTDAAKRKPGRFELAQGGTLFLDEIGDTSPALQVKLLRAIQEKEIEPLGSTKPVKVDVRIICATNKDLLKLVKEGKFREDLYYRINVIKLSLPPLKERREDIPLLIEHFITKYNAIMGKNITGITEDAMDILMNYSYPGNIRELENIIEHAFVLSKGSVIDVDDLPAEVKNAERYEDTGILTLAEIEKRTIVKTLRISGYNKQKAAELLGIDRTTLWRKIKHYNIDIDIIKE